MKKDNDIEKKQLEKEVEESINFIDYNLSIFETIADSVIVDKNLPKALSSLRKIIFDYIDGNKHMDICEDIILIDKIVSDTYTDFSSNMLASDTYSNNDDEGMDKLDNKYLVDLIRNTTSKIEGIINKSDEKVDDLSREDARIDYLRKELNNIVMKLKMRGIISYNVSMDKINEVIEYVASNFYPLHLSIIEPLFIENIKNINNVSYEKYDIEMDKISLHTSVNNIENNIYAFLDEDGEDKLKEIRDIIKNTSDFDTLENIKIILDYLESIVFIRYEYPSVDIWKKMFLELLSMVVDLMNRLNKENNKEELIKIKELYLNLKKKYYEMIFIGNSIDLIDIKNTERENLLLVRK